MPTPVRPAEPVAGHPETIGRDTPLATLVRVARDRLAAGGTGRGIRRAFEGAGVAPEVARVAIAAARSARRAAGLAMVFHGFLLMGAGVALTALSYGLASPGGSYRIMIGLVVVGGIRFLQGLVTSVAG